MKGDSLIKKDGWHVAFECGVPVWVEDVPQFNNTCIHCHGSGRVRNPDCECVGWTSSRFTESVTPKFIRCSRSEN